MRQIFQKWHFTSDEGAIVHLRGPARLHRSRFFPNGALHDCGIHIFSKWLHARLHRSRIFPNGVMQGFVVFDCQILHPDGISSYREIPVSLEMQPVRIPFECCSNTVLRLF